MKFERIISPDSSEFQWAFRLYESSFPLHERRTRAAQEARLSCPDYHFTLFSEGAQPMGLLLYWEGSGLRYVEHFAVAEDLRGTGVGSRALGAFCGGGSPVVLEIDPPVDGISRRRREFYLRCGFADNPYPHVHPPYRAGFAGHPLAVLSFPAALRGEEYEAFAAYLAGTVMSDCVPPLTGE